MCIRDRYIVKRHPLSLRHSEKDIRGPIADYFENNYISEKEILPAISKKIWNLHERTLNGDAKTQVHQEAWHGAFAKVL